MTLSRLWMADKYVRLLLFLNVFSIIGVLLLMFTLQGFTSTFGISATALLVIGGAPNLTAWILANQAAWEMIKMKRKLKAVTENARFINALEKIVQLIDVLDDIAKTPEGQMFLKATVETLGGIKNGEVKT